MVLIVQNTDKMESNSVTLSKKVLARKTKGSVYFILSEGKALAKFDMCKQIL